ncbi:hypothetical protein EBZ37_08760, partial [bacterium]|nr:hypothetical protein [bacterium]
SPTSWTPRSCPTHLQSFGATSCTTAVIDSTIEIYHKISEELRATPAKFHYMFNLRDVSKVI